MQIKVLMSIKRERRFGPVFTNKKLKFSPVKIRKSANGAMR
jgi:hypothetical protein